MNPADHLQVGRAVKPGNLYVERSALDPVALEVLRAGELCFIVGPRQVGKSSLRVRLAATLRNQGIACGEVDLNKLGTRTATEATFFLSLASEVVDSLGFEEGSWSDWWKKGSGSPIHSWTRFIRENVVARHDGRIVLFFDEFDDLLNVRFSAEDFILAIRSLYNERATCKALERITFCLLASHPPSRFTQDPTRSPLNLGRVLWVSDFTTAEARKHYLPLLAVPWKNPSPILEEVLGWTDGHPFWTQRLLRLLLGRGAIPPSRARRTVGEVVEETFLASDSYDAIGLDYAERRCISEEPEASGLAKLQLYERLLEYWQIEGRAEDPVQVALQLAGLAAWRSAEGGRVLQARNQIYATAFDQTWIATQRRRLAHPEQKHPVDTVPEADRARLARVRDLVRKIFCEGGIYELRKGGEEIFERYLYRFRLREATSRELVAVQVFLGIEEGLAGELWKQEVRALQRLAARRHPAIPRILEGAWLEDEVDEPVAYIITEVAADTLREPGAVEEVRRDKVAAIRQLAILAEGLGILHTSGILHRNLWPGSIEVLPRREDEALRLRLSRFEMSSLLNNLLRVGSTDETNRLELGARRLARAQESAALACMPPERLTVVFGKSGAQTFEGPKADVYSLGMLAFQWLVGPLPEAALSAAFPTGNYDPSGHQDLLDTINSRISQERRNGALPEEVADLLRGMLALRWDDRPDASEVVTYIARNFENIADKFSSDGNACSSPLPLLLSYSPEDCGQRLREWGRLSLDPVTTEGKAELRSSLANDLAAPRLTYSPEGYAPFTLTPQEKHHGARYVLLGKQLVYFCEPFHPPGFSSERYRVVPEVLHIAYFLPKQNAVRLQRNIFRRRIPRVDLWPYHAEELRNPAEEGFPSWEPLLESVRQRQDPPWHVAVEEALLWLQQVERARVDCRTYAVQVINGGTCLRADTERDFRWITATPLRALVSSHLHGERRPPLGEFIEMIQEENPDVSWDLVPDLRGSPGFKGRRDYRSIKSVQRLSLDTLTVIWGDPGKSFPEKGWLQPADNQGTRHQLYEQRKAYDRLLGMSGLLDQIGEPARSIRMPRRHLHGDRGLRGNASEIIDQIIASDPFFALLGPPGTGKTTILSHAITESLESDRGLRILVAAQSHYALDHLAERVLAQLRTHSNPELHPDRLHVVRITSPQSEGKVSETMRQYELTRKTQDLIKHIEEKSLERIRQGDPMADILGRWSREARFAAFELQERLRSGANLVFTTTGSATDRQLGELETQESCDWVIIEEAAKAWLTELALPLVRGLRWTLVGDPRQLPPFGDNDIRRLLKACGERAEPELKRHNLNRDRYLQVFDFFQRLFAPRQEGQSFGRFIQAQRPVEQLKLQFRMPPELGNLVSEAFYDKQLDTEPGVRRDHAFVAPNFIHAGPLVWIDTSRILEAREEGRWYNLEEARTVARLAAQLRPRVTSKLAEDRVAVLSPYLAQNEKIRDFLRANDLEFLRDRVKTVDSFQGREADVVIVSLVRHNERGRLGFLEDPQRVNVMFSRARCLLVVVGCFHLFQMAAERAHGGPSFWPIICGHMEKFRIPAETLKWDLDGGRTTK